MQEFQTKLDRIEDKAREIGEHMIIAGNFNSRATEWGMTTTNSRDRRVLEIAASLSQIEVYPPLFVDQDVLVPLPM